MNIILTLLIATIGGIIANKLKVPAGYLIGALFATSLYNILSSNAYITPQLRIITQIISGIFIGSSMNRSEILILRKSVKPALLTIVLLFVACIAMGIVVHLITDYDLVTTLFATAPGGLLDTTLMSYEMRANTAVVSVLQVTRLITVIALFPTLLNLIIAKFIFKNNEQTSNKQKEVKQRHLDITLIDKLKKLGITLIVGCSFGLLGYFSKIPAGTLMFTMIGAAILNIFWCSAYIPNSSKKLAQVLGGALIGTNVTATSIIEMKNLIIPGILMIIALFIINILLALILHKKCKMDMVTALFSCTPGGASTISLMADDFGANTSIVSTLQILRVICVIALYPFIIQFIYFLIN